METTFSSRNATDRFYGVPTGSVPHAIHSEPVVADVSNTVHLTGTYVGYLPTSENVKFIETGVVTAANYAVPKNAHPTLDTESKKHSHYFKDVSHLKTIDVYRVLELFGVTDQALGHAIKKLLVAGGRGAGKDINKDIAEAIDTLNRRQEMQKENNV